MKVVMDEKIPYLREALAKMGHDVLTLPGSAIRREDVENADALFVRTRTKCNESLLSGSKVRFIGTATIGYDHIDAEYCKSHGIEWASAPGCNADAVLQYVQSCIYSWAKECGYDISTLTLGIVGVGQIGSRVERWAHSIGMRVLLNDPPRALRGDTGFVPLSEIADRCDVITFHPTLSRDGDFPSYHLADRDFIESLSHCNLLINASRGPVVDNEALLSALTCGKLLYAALDVWEGEPEISLQLLDRMFIATPHIAGYSAEGKMNASRMMVEAFAAFAGYKGALPAMQLPLPSDNMIVGDSESDALLSIYSPLDDTAMLKGTPEKFEDLRNNYNLRREPSAFQILLRK